jgi:hypothetical protein
MVYELLSGVELLIPGTLDCIRGGRNGSIRCRMWLVFEGFVVAPVAAGYDCWGAGAMGAAVRHSCMCGVKVEAKWSKLRLASLI